MSNKTLRKYIAYSTIFIYVGFIWIGVLAFIDNNIVSVDFDNTLIQVIGFLPMLCVFLVWWIFKWYLSLLNILLSLYLLKDKSNLIFYLIIIIINSIFILLYFIYKDEFFSTWSHL